MNQRSGPRQILSPFLLMCEAGWKVAQLIACYFTNCPTEFELTNCGEKPRLVAAITFPPLLLLVLNIVLSHTRCIKLLLYCG